MHPENQHHTEALWHSALIRGRILDIGTLQAHVSTRELLHTYTSFAAIARAYLEGDDTGYPRGAAYAPLLSTLELLSDTFRAITPQDALYPGHMYRRLYAPPALYTTGDASLLDSASVALVMPRELPDAAAVRRCSRQVSALVRKGYTLVCGIDTPAQRRILTTALQHMGRCVALQSTAFAEQRYTGCEALQQAIETEGALVSYIPPGIDKERLPGHYHITALASMAREGVLLLDPTPSAGTMHLLRACLRQSIRVYMPPQDEEANDTWTDEIFTPAAAYLR